MLTILDALPGGFLDAEPTRLVEVLDGPTLIHLPGRRSRPLFVSVLLHGNEITGLCAVQALLCRYAGLDLPRALSLFIGNVAAAGHGVRRLDDQLDYNRIWAGGPTPEHAMAAQVVEEMRRRQPFASVDIHNNTGLNPHYACVNHLDHRFLHLAVLFSHTVVYFTRPATVQSRAFAKLCPAVALECGQPGTEHGLEHALNYLEGCLHLSEFPSHPVPHQDIELLHTVATVKVPEEFSFGFGECERDICFTHTLDHLNFRELPAGIPLARVNGVQCLPLQVEDEQGNPVAERFLVLEDGEICTTRPVIPSMFTLDERAIRQDCLGYFMERLSPEALERTRAGEEGAAG